ncbi:C1 family peptidase [Flavobacterium sp. T12S277]|uniref:C1 family peptidase n=1 Tax=Flavobacterium sp. T12S277 TaxID=3402752 RepID=UPI003AE01D65
MKKPLIKFSIRKIALVLFALLALYSCDKGNDQAEADVQQKLMDGNVDLLDKGRYGLAQMPDAYLKSIEFLTPVDYRARIAELRPDLITSTQKMSLTAKVAAVKNLPTPPVGDQGSEGSCVGWGVGYAAHSIARYLNNSVHQSNWSGASRSAAYIYNQIKLGNCGAGSYPNDAMNLIKNQGECSEAQMPYIAGGCFTQPSTQQKNWAAARKTGGWFNVNPRSTADIKYYLNQNYAVAVCFDVNQSFYDIRNNNHVWSSLYGSRQGGHCVCIVGYDDATGLFKVQNSWGAGWGRSGFFYVTYANIANGAFNWAGCIIPNPGANS